MMMVVVAEENAEIESGWLLITAVVEIRQKKLGITRLPFLKCDLFWELPGVRQAWRVNFLFGSLY
jgi:hypothetical protein